MQLNKILPINIAPGVNNREGIAKSDGRRRRRERNTAEQEIRRRESHRHWLRGRLQDEIGYGLEPLVSESEAMASAFLSQPAAQVDRRADQRTARSQSRRGGPRGKEFNCVIDSIRVFPHIGVFGGFAVCARAGVLQASGSHLQKRKREG